MHLLIYLNFIYYKTKSSEVLKTGRYKMYEKWLDKITKSKASKHHWCKLPHLHRSFVNITLKTKQKIQGVTVCQPPAQYLMFYSPYENKKNSENYDVTCFTFIKIPESWVIGFFWRISLWQFQLRFQHWNIKCVFKSEQETCILHLVGFAFVMKWTDKKFRFLSLQHWNGRNDANDQDNKVH